MAPALLTRPIVAAAWTAGLLVCTTALATAQTAEPRLDQLRRTFQTDYLSLGALLQTVADFQIDRTQPGNNGFSIANFRLLLQGELDMGFGYFIQTKFEAQPAILDARMYFRVSERVTLHAGQFKAPFSFEFLTPASSIDFVNRSQAVTALVPGRQIGMQVSGSFDDGRIGFDAGAFNGNSTVANGNDSDALMYSARLHVTRPIGNRSDASTIRAGANVAFSRDESASFGSGFVSGFTGYRTLLGVDVRATVDRYLLSGELIGSWLDAEVGPTRTPWGLHLTGGYMVNPTTQILVRWDGFEPDAGVGRTDWLVLGGNVWPTGATEVQVNYIVDLGDAAPNRHQVLINFQIGF